MKSRMFPAVVMVFASFVAVTPPVRASDEPASKQDILQLFEVMQIHQQMRQILNSMVAQQSALLQETMKERYPQITQERLSRFDAMMQESMKDFPVDAMLEDVIPIYQKHLTKADVDAMSAFYSSPTGQKLLRQMPEMTSESMEAAYVRMQKHMESMVSRIEKMMKEEGPNGKQSPKPRPQPRPQVQQN